MHKNFKFQLATIILLYQIYLELIKIREYILSIQPKLSIFLPIYNKECYIMRSIGSLQNQTFKNIEIVAVNDGSKDNTLKILKKLAKKDNRIKIINNDRNHGLLYSRAMGILNCTGKYLMNLDPDDKLADKNSLEILNNNIKYKNLDLIIFLIKRIPTNQNEIEFTLKENLFQLSNEDYRITNKLFSKKIIQKAYEYFKTQIFGNKWNFHEDNIWNILVRKYSRYKLNFTKYIYIYKRNNESLNFQKGSLLEFKNRIYKTKVFIKILKNEQNSLQKYYKYLYY